MERKEKESPRSSLDQRKVLFVTVNSGSMRREIRVLNGNLRDET